MGVLDNIKDKIKKIFNLSSDAEFIQYIHRGSCFNPCPYCPTRHLKIYKKGEHVQLPAHLRCDCAYRDIEEQAVGTISNNGIHAPDVYLKAYGKLPDYYIIKEEAYKLGWEPGKNLSYFAPGKMIGGNRFYNREGYLPEKEGRIWYECDVDYSSGLRYSERLYYSNDGLMFYSINHGESEFIYIK